MVTKEKVIAVVPARGGSQRIPNKNIALFKGKTLVENTIEQVLESDIFDQCVVTTDDTKIKKIASKYPIIIHNREPQLAGNKATIINVIRNLAKTFNWSHNAVIGLLQVTAPLRIVGDIRNAFQLFKASDHKNAVVSVCMDAHPIHMSWSIDEQNRLIPVFGEEGGSTRKQDYPATYYWNDAVLFDRVGNFFDPKRNLFGKKPIPYVMPGERSVNIDYQYQLTICQALADKI